MAGRVVSFLMSVFLVIGVVGLAPWPAAAVEPASLVSWWRAEGNAEDSADGNHGTIYGATFSDGRVGKAFSFDGVDDYIDAGGNSNLKITGELSVAAWFKTTSSGWNSLVNSYDYYTWPYNGKKGYGLVVYAGKVRFDVYQYLSADAYDAAITTAAFDYGVWHHAVGVFPANGTDRVQIYVDGVLQSVERYGSAKAYSTASTVNVNIGRAGPSTYQPTAYFFNGLIDEVRIYSRALTAAEISGIYGAPSDTTPPLISPTMSGAEGRGGWYTSDVDISWGVTDAESEVTSKTGCDSSTVTADTAGTTFTCTATSAGGTASKSVVLKRDPTPAAIAYSGNAGTYTVDQTVNIACLATDNLSGIASHTCQNIGGPAYSFPLGTNSFSATATDNAGNVGSGSTTFTVEVTHSSLGALVQSFVSQPGVANSMLAKLRAAEAAAARGNANAKAGAIGAFINEVQAQSGKTLTADQAATLIRLARGI